MSALAPVTVLTCPDCKGTAIITSDYRDDRACTTCVGGEVTIDVEAIRAAITNSRGAAKGTFRKSRPASVMEAPKPFVYGAAYCWRMIRFHNGADVHLPMFANDYVGVGWLIKDESRAVIDLLDDVTAMLGTEMFGKRMLTGTGRWAKALYGDTTVLDAAGVDPMDPAHWGNGSDIGDIHSSPEAALEEATDLDGNTDLDSLSEQLATTSV